MKKIIGILGVSVIAATMFFNFNAVSGSSTDTTLASLITMNTANAEPADNLCTFLKEKVTSQQLVCTSVNGSLAISAGLTVGVVQNNVTASAAAKAQCTWELKNCYKVNCYADSGKDCCTPISIWTICATGGC